MKFPIPDDWDGESWCKWSICWPDSELWEGFLRGLITLPQRGRTWDERSGIIRDAQEIGVEITSRNLPLNGVIMACNDVEVVAAFNSIAQSIRLLANRQCCDNLQIDVQGGIQGTIEQESGETIPIYGTQPPAEIAPGAFPDGYADLDEYQTDKCKKANAIFDGIVGSLTNIAGIGTFNAATLAVLIGASMLSSIVFPPAMIPTAISVLIILSGSLFLVAQLVTLLNDNRQEVVCKFYQGENATAIVDGLADLLDILIASIPVSGALAYALKSLVLLVANTDTLNRLFTSDPMITSDEVDCSDCIPEWWTCLLGEYVSHTDDTVTVISQVAPDFDYLSAVAYGNEETMVNLSAEILDGVWVAPSDLPDFASAYADDETLCGAGAGGEWDVEESGFQVGPVLARVLQHRTNDPLTIRYTRS